MSKEIVKDEKLEQSYVSEIKDLKVKAYDILATQQSLQQQLNEINQEIAKRIQALQNMR